MVEYWCLSENKKKNKNKKQKELKAWNLLIKSRIIKWLNMSRQEIREYQFKNIREVTFKKKKKRGIGVWFFDLPSLNFDCHYGKINAIQTKNLP